ncbi:MAG: GNAT family N-acetyltransferase [Ruminococcaceae bacterium]|nr:GNAT family N-acetyltransferase [Oscillospiraceae bacterium]HHV32466.1 GNAT family N-acetyltransferase [Clostridiales bacterium]
MYKLTRLTSEMEREYQDYIEEWRHSGEMIVPMSSDHQELTYTQYLNSLRAFEHEETCPKNFVPGTTWFYVNDAGRILGAVNLRHRLNESLLNFGGHIGYGVRPSERRKGYACAMLALALEESKKLGLTRVLVTCDKKNIASARTIQKNGGVLENEVLEDGRITQRYWIALA